MNRYNDNIVKFVGLFSEQIIFGSYRE